MKFYDALRLLALCVEHGILSKNEDDFISVVSCVSPAAVAEQLTEEQKDLLTAELSRRGFDAAELHNSLVLIQTCVEQKILEEDDYGRVIVNELRHIHDLARSLVDDREGQEILTNALAEKGVAFEEQYDKIFPSSFHLPSLD